MISRWKDICVSRGPCLRVLGGWFVVALFPSAACSASFDEPSLSRSIDRKSALTNSAITATAVFTNGLTDLRGFLYSDQLPSTLVVEPLSLMLNGVSVTNYSIESGEDGDVYPGHKPWRWILETPVQFAQTNPIPPRTQVRIVYSISSAAPGIFTLPQFGWAAGGSDMTNAHFGHSEVFESRTIKFTASLEEPLLTWSPADGLFSISVNGEPNSIYLLCVSSNLLDWLPVATNLSPFSVAERFLDAPQHFFLALPYLVKEANLFLRPLTANTFRLSVEAVHSAPYILEQSLDLFTWIPIATNFAPFQITVTNVSGAPEEFYRARLLEW
jgi:hypothetical protein